MKHLSVTLVALSIALVGCSDSETTTSAVTSTAGTVVVNSAKKAAFDNYVPGSPVESTVESLAGSYYGRLEFTWVTNMVKGMGEISGEDTTEDEEEIQDFFDQLDLSLTLNNDGTYEISALSPEESSNARGTWALSAGGTLVTVSEPDETSDPMDMGEMDLEVSPDGRVLTASEESDQEVTMARLMFLKK